MIKEFSNYNLRNLNTFRMNVNAEKYISFNSENDLFEIYCRDDFRNSSRLILGGGSNLLFTKDFNGLVLHPQMKGISIQKETSDFAIVNVKAGENWDSFVAYAVENGFGGIENLSLIPGNVGAAPVQNIGAYGVEVKDVIDKVRFFNLYTLQFNEFSNKECAFGYRDSIFKYLNDKFIITEVTFRLSKKPRLLLDYGNVKEELKKFDEINLKNLRQAIINIRTTKLPDPIITPNSGSFFKNPVVSKLTFEAIEKINTTVPHYTISLDKEKIPAAWLIEQCGWKGYRDGDAGVHVNQPLVLVNYGNATGNEILNLAKKVIASVKEKFDIQLEMEVNVA